MARVVNASSLPEPDFQMNSSVLRKSRSKAIVDEGTKMPTTLERILIIRRNGR
jgi:hypothetical protein